LSHPIFWTRVFIPFGEKLISAIKNYANKFKQAGRTKILELSYNLIDEKPKIS